ncbi:MAG: hypothetical protein PHN98_07400 [Smithellaceae bacterium]|nr:hypothetical protein [Smithellaceae bacterium]
MSKPVVGLLPLYLRLYDDVVPELRQEMESFAAIIKQELEKRNLKVIAAPVNCVAAEFAEAVKTLEKHRVEVIVTLHLAYSPSLESAGVLAATRVPLIMLDTTPDFEFGFNIDAKRIMSNHGIHGVQDLANMLIRKEKSFMIEAGHWRNSNVLDRIIADVKACLAAEAMKTAVVGIIGSPFSGMGDFAVPFPELEKSIGIKIIHSNPGLLRTMQPKNTEVENELRNYSDRFIKDDNISQECLFRTASTALTVRNWIEQEKLSAFTFNFMDIDGECGLTTIPFLEASQAMARGIGYAGEGDVLTAVLVASLLKIFPDTTFAEMFCPDWKGNRVFLSHMGEVNVNILAAKPHLTEKDLPFFDAESPAAAEGIMKSGMAALVNLAPGPQGSFSMIVCAGKMQAPEETAIKGICGWFRPDMQLERMLEEYSQHGGTHHLALVYNPDYQIMRQYAKIMNWNFVIF